MARDATKGNDVLATVAKDAADFLKEAEAATTRDTTDRMAEIGERICVSALDSLIERLGAGDDLPERVGDTLALSRALAGHATESLSAITKRRDLTTP